MYVKNKALALVSLIILCLSGFYLFQGIHHRVLRIDGENEEPGIGSNAWSRTPIDLNRSCIPAADGSKGHDRVPFSRGDGECDPLPVVRQGA